MELFVFVKGRQILEGFFLLNEVVAWYMAYKKHLLVFKMEFEKSYESLSWEYLLGIMLILGFGSRWCSRILEMLRSARASILDSGSPTQEFHIKRGLRHGDHFHYYFLFLQRRDCMLPL